MNTQTNRRSVLMGIAATPAAATISVAGTPEELHDPVVDWVEEWMAGVNRSKFLSKQPGGGDGELPEQIELEAKQDKLAERIAKTPALTSPIRYKSLLISNSIA